MDITVWATLSNTGAEIIHAAHGDIEVASPIRTLEKLAKRLIEAAYNPDETTYVRRNGVLLFPPLPLVDWTRPVKNSPRGY